MAPYKQLSIWGGIQCGRCGLSLFIAWLIGNPLIEAATRERGYEGAYGGEWLLIITVFVMAYMFSERLIKPP